MGNQITIEEYIEELRLYDEFSKYMNKPEKEEGNESFRIICRNKEHRKGI